MNTPTLTMVCEKCEPSRYREVMRVMRVGAKPIRVVVCGDCGAYIGRPLAECEKNYHKKRSKPCRN